jgi:hypothetical protein
VQHGIDIMTDGMFWSRLEFAACGWLATSADTLHRKYWIDGFVPEEFCHSNAGMQISGRVSMVSHQAYEDFRFFTCMPWRIATRGRQLFQIEHIEIDEEGRTVELSFRATLKKPNKAPEPTSRTVTPRADARVAPARAVAHL